MREKLIEKIEEKILDMEIDELCSFFKIDLYDVIQEKCIEILEYKEIDELLEIILEM